MSACRRCVTAHSGLLAAEAEVRRLARMMARTSSPVRLASLKEQLAVAKVNRTLAREESEQGHECDTRMSDEHWTKKRA